MSDKKTTLCCFWGTRPKVVFGGDVFFFSCAAGQQQRRDLGDLFCLEQGYSKELPAGSHDGNAGVCPTYLSQVEWVLG